MMRTNQDLQGAFALLEEQADAYGAPEITAELRPTQRSVRPIRPVLAVCAAVAAVLAAVAGVALVLIPHRHATPPTAPPAVPFQIGFTVDTPDGRQPQQRDVAATYQEMILRGGNALVRVYAPGTFDSAAVQGGKSVKVNGHDGYFGPLRRDQPMLAPGAQVLAWPYAPDSWALVSSGARDDPADQQLAGALPVARAVHVGGAIPLKVPFRLGYLPSGVAATSASSWPDAAVSEGVVSFDGDALTVTVNRQGLDDVVPHCSSSDAKPVTVNGHHGCFRDDNGAGEGRRLQLQIPGGWLTVQVTRSHLYSDATLRRIAASVTLATLDQPATWFDADTALPH